MKKDGCICMVCKRNYIGDLIVSDSIWQRISPNPVAGYKGGGLLCGACIVDRIVSFGIATVVFASI